MNPLGIILFTLALPTVLAIVAGFLLTMWRRALGIRAPRQLYAANNEADFRGDMLTIAAPAAANGGVGPNSGDPMMLGTGTSPGFGMAGVCETSYTEPSGLVPTGNVSVKFVGVFFLSVLGKSSIGGAGLAFAPGDKVYYAGGTYDPTTGWWYGGTLCGDKVNGAAFGVTLDPIVSGQTTTVRVKLKQSAG
jgi:hypothetical protein